MKTSTSAQRADSLDFIAQKVVEAVAQQTPIHESTIEVVRADREERGNPLAPPACDLASIEDQTIPSTGGPLKIRIYRPKIESSNALPALVYYHGGGFALGDIDGHDTVTQHLAAFGGCIVISVDYRLAPETKAPGLAEDAFDSFQWVVQNAASLNIDPNKIAVGGDSAGGNLATVTALRCRDEKAAAPAFQLLIYPVTDAYSKTSSMNEFAEGYFLTQAGMSWFFDLYLSDPSQADDPMISPLRAKDLSNLPPALVITAGFDPLRDEGKAYADRLSEAGVQVTHTCYEDMIHGFVSFAGGMPQGIAALKECGTTLKEALA